MERDLDKEIEKLMRRVISSEFDTQENNITITSVEIDQENHEIRISFNLKTESSATEVAEKYFGLTRAVRKQISSAPFAKFLSGFFPVISPRFTSKLNA